MLMLFDVDGTLIETGGAGRQALIAAFEHVFDRHGIEDTAGRVRFQGRTDPVIVTAMADAIDLDRAELRAREDAFWQSYLEHLRVLMSRPDDRRRTLPGVRELLAYLDRRDDVFLGLLTGNIEAGARAKLDAFDLNRYFPDGGFASDHHDRREIARLARLKLSQHHGIAFEARSTVVIGDTEFDIDCGRANRFRTVAVDSGWVPRDELEQARPDVLLDDFTDLARTLAALGLDGATARTP